MSKSHTKPDTAANSGANQAAGNKGHTLLPIARASISTALGRPLQAQEHEPWLQASGACFVTLTQRGQLRGCIGTLEARRSLLADVKANALAAAFADPRFSPLTAFELAQTEIEVSLLSAMHAMEFDSEAHALAQLQPGMDGVVFEYAHYRSTFLPQVWEQLPNAAEFMAHLKHKAGLPSDFWATGVRLQRYSVSKFKESELEPASAHGPAKEKP
ncbi:MAG: AmmeMemoRadiSam system protein A [Rhodoferax sp.]